MYNSEGESCSNVLQLCVLNVFKVLKLTVLNVLKILKLIVSNVLKNVETHCFKSLFQNILKLIVSWNPQSVKRTAVPLFDKMIKVESNRDELYNNLEKN